MSPAAFPLIVSALGWGAWGLSRATLTILRQPRAAPAAATSGSTAAPSRPAGESEAKASDVTVEKVPEKQRKPLTPGQLAVSRRQFLNRAWSY